jgi:hypothetical protein
MRIDTLTSPLPPGSAAVSMVAAAGAAVQVGQIIDLLGLGVGMAPTSIIGNAALFGTDLGIGMLKGQLESIVGTAFTTSSACTLNLQMQAAPDTGSGGSYQPGTWQTLVETGQLTAAQLTAGTIFGRFDFPPVFPSTLRPRFIRLVGQTLAAATFTAGTIALSILTLTRDDQANKQATRNYVVA